jgi:signal transduction histidine kinase
MAVADVAGLDWTRRSERRVPVALAVGVAGLIAVGITAWAAASSTTLVDSWGLALWRSGIVAAYVAVGVHTWWRRPESRLGPLVAALGFMYAATSFAGSEVAVVYTLGMVVWAAAIVYSAYVYLCFPRGRLESALERRFLLLFALSTALVWAFILALSPTLPPGGSFVSCGTRCPPNALQLVGGQAATGAVLTAAFHIVVSVSTIGVAMLIVNKARSSSYSRRRAITPLAVVFIAYIVEFVIALFVLPAYPGTREALRVAGGVLTLAIPVSILIGQIQGDVFAARSLRRIAVRNGTQLTPATVQNVLRDALRDSTLRLAVWSPDGDGYVDVEGTPLDLRGESRERAVTPITQGDQPVAALVHDPTFAPDSDVVEGLVAASVMALENSRLLEELRASRARIVAAAQRERLRLERDLHDGAQQRLMGIQIKLRMAQQHSPSQALVEELEEIGLDAAEAVEELRALAHGIYPAVLRDRGLADAFRSLAMSAPIPLQISDDGIGRCDGATEAAIYFCALEAIQNAVKHAGAGARVTVALGRDERRIHFVIADDGIGMDTRKSADGVGLISMHDRIGAVAGELEIVSSPGRGTSIRGTVPDGTPNPNDRPNGSSR